jgi:hypothetical protein
MIMTEKAKDIVTAHGSRFTSESGDEKLARLAAGYIDDAVGSLPQADASSDLVRAQTYALIGIGHALLAISHQLTYLEVSINR